LMCLNVTNIFLQNMAAQCVLKHVLFLKEKAYIIKLKINSKTIK